MMYYLSSSIQVFLTGLVPCDMDNSGAISCQPMRSALRRHSGAAVSSGFYWCCGGKRTEDNVTQAYIVESHRITFKCFWHTSIIGNQSDLKKQGIFQHFPTFNQFFFVTVDSSAPGAALWHYGRDSGLLERGFQVTGLDMA